jgi:hypothetical protein
VTDGMQERNAAELDVAAGLAASAQLHPGRSGTPWGRRSWRPPRNAAGRRHGGVPGLVRRADEAPPQFRWGQQRARLGLTGRSVPAGPRRALPR